MYDGFGTRGLVVSKMRTLIQYTVCRGYWILSLQSVRTGSVYSGNFRLKRGRPDLLSFVSTPDLTLSVGDPRLPQGSTVGRPFTPRVRMLTLFT